MTDTLPFAAPRFSVSATEIPWLEIGGQTLYAILYRPAGEGPFPAAVCVHGGAWVSGDRTATQGFADMVAACGVAVFAIDFRMPPAWPYPAALVDINCAIRWLRRNAARYDIAPERIGGLGVSSGGHLILLSALRPHDSRYAAMAVEGGVDASLAFVATCSGVLDPVARYNMAYRAGDTDILACHNAFFGDAGVMEEASPAAILAGGEAVFLPPAIFFQGEKDGRVPADTASRLAGLYRRAGGYADAIVYPGMEHAIGSWDRPAFFDMLGKIMALIRQQSPPVRRG